MTGALHVYLQTICARRLDRMDLELHREQAGEAEERAEAEWLELQQEHLIEGEWEPTEGPNGILY